MVSNIIDHGLNVAEASLAPRVHHQWLPDELQVERGLSPDTIRLLEASLASPCATPSARRNRSSASATCGKAPRTRDSEAGRRWGIEGAISGKV